MRRGDSNRTSLVLGGDNDNRETDGLIRLLSMLESLTVRLMNVGTARSQNSQNVVQAEGRTISTVRGPTVRDLRRRDLAETEGFEPSIGLYNPITV